LGALGGKRVKIRAKERIWALLLAVFLVVGTIPIYALADQGVGQEYASITEFAPLAPETALQRVPLGTSWEALDLPGRLAVGLALGESSSDGMAEVLLWESTPEYDPETAGTYQLNPVLSTDYALGSSGAEPPQITVVLYASVTGTAARTLNLIRPEASGGEEAPVEATPHGDALANPYARELWEHLRDLQYGDSMPRTLTFSQADAPTFALADGYTPEQLEEVITQLSSQIQVQVAQPAATAFWLDFPLRFWPSEMVELELDYTIENEAIRVDAARFTFAYGAMLSSFAITGDFRVWHGGQEVAGYSTLKAAVDYVNNTLGVTSTDGTIIRMYANGTVATDNASPSSATAISAMPTKPCTIVGMGTGIQLQLTTTQPMRRTTLNIKASGTVRIQNVAIYSNNNGVVGSYGAYVSSGSNLILDKVSFTTNSGHAGQVLPTASNLELTLRDVTPINALDGANTWGQITIGGSGTVMQNMFNTDKLVLESEATLELSYNEGLTDPLITANSITALGSGGTIFHSGLNARELIRITNATGITSPIQGKLTLDRPSGGNAPDYSNVIEFTHTSANRSTVRALMERLLSVSVVNEEETQLLLGDGYDPIYKLYLVASTSQTSSSIGVKGFAVKVTKTVGDVTDSVDYATLKEATTAINNEAAYDNATNIILTLRNSLSNNKTYCNITTGVYEDELTLPARKPFTLVGETRRNITPSLISQKPLVLNNNVRMENVILAGVTGTSIAPVDLQIGTHTLAIVGTAVDLSKVTIQTGGAANTGTLELEQGAEALVAGINDINTLTLGKNSSLTSAGDIEVETAVTLEEGASVDADNIKGNASFTLEDGAQISIKNQIEALRMKSNGGIINYTAAAYSGIPILVLTGASPSYNGTGLTITAGETTGFAVNSKIIELDNGVTIEQTLLDKIELAGALRNYLLGLEASGGKHYYVLEEVVASVVHDTEEEKFTSLSSAIDYVNTKLTGISSIGRTKLHLWQDLTFTALPTQPVTITGVRPGADESLSISALKTAANGVELNEAMRFENIKLQATGAGWTLNAAGKALELGKGVTFHCTDLTTEYPDINLIGGGGSLETDPSTELSFNTISGFGDVILGDETVLTLNGIYDYVTLNSTAESQFKFRTGGAATTGNMTFPTNDFIADSEISISNDAYSYVPAYGDRLVRMPIGTGKPATEALIKKLVFSDGYSGFTYDYQSNTTGFDYYILDEKVDHISVTPGAPSYVYGEEITVTVKLLTADDKPFTNRQGGTVDLYVGQEKIADGAVGTDGGTAIITVSSRLNAGTHTLRAEYVDRGETAPTVEEAQITITPKPLTVAFINTTIDKTVITERQYDGTADVALVGGTKDDLFILTGVLQGDIVTVSDAKIVFDDKDAHPNKDITASNFTLSNSNYIIGSGTTISKATTVAILPKDITVTATINKVYDGNTSITHIDSYFLSGVVSGESLTLIPGTLEFVSWNAGSNISVTGSWSFTANGTTRYDNYQLIAPTNLTGTITKRPVSVDASTITDSNNFRKVYDGTAEYTTIGGVSASLLDTTGTPDNGLVAGEQLTLKPTRADYLPVGSTPASYVGSDKNLRVVFSLGSSGTWLATNYTLNPDYYETSNSPGEITSLPVTVVSPPTIYVRAGEAVNGAYDLNRIPYAQGTAGVPGNTTYAIISSTNPGFFSTSGLSGTANFIYTTNANLENAENEVTIKISSENYQDTTATLKFVATAKTELTIEGLSISDKVYDGIQVAVSGTPVFRNSQTNQIVTGNITLSAPLWYDVRNDRYYVNVENVMEAGDYIVYYAIDSTIPDYRGEVEISFTISKAPLTITPKNKSASIGDDVPTWTIDTPGDFIADGLVTSLDYDLKSVLGSNSLFVKRGSLSTDLRGIFDVEIEDIADEPVNYSIDLRTGTFTVLGITPGDGWFVFNPAEPNGANGWYVTEITVSPDPGSSYQHIYAAGAGENPDEATTFEPSVTLDTPAANGIDASEDLYLSTKAIAGVISEPYSFSYRLDNTGPEIADTEYVQTKNVLRGEVQAAVTDDESGIAGVKIKMPAGEEFDMIRGGDGRYSMTVEQSGTYQITATNNAGLETTNDVEIVIRDITGLEIYYDGRVVTNIGAGIPGGNNIPQTAKSSVLRATGTTIQLEARTKLGSVATWPEDFDYHWTTNAPAVATVDESTGEVTLISAGAATISVSAMGHTEPVELTVYREYPVLPDIPDKAPEGPAGVVPPGTAGIDALDLVLVIDPLDSDARSRMANAASASANQSIQQFLTNPDWETNFSLWFSLRLLNKANGYEDVPLTGPMTIYLPFPQGTNPADNSYLLLTMVNDAVEEIPVVMTDYGIRFTMTGLTPLALLWDKAPTDPGTDPGTTPDPDPDDPDPDNPNPGDPDPGDPDPGDPDPNDPAPDPSRPGGVIDGETGGSSGGGQGGTGSGSADRERTDSFWSVVKASIRMALNGETVYARAPAYVYTCPVSVLQMLSGKDISLRITWAGETLLINGMDVEYPKDSIVFFYLANLVPLYGIHSGYYNNSLAAVDLQNPVTGGDDVVIGSQGKVRVPVTIADILPTFPAPGQGGDMPGPGTEASIEAAANAGNLNYLVIILIVAAPWALWSMYAHRKVMTADGVPEITDTMPTRYMPSVAVAEQLIDIPVMPPAGPMTAEPPPISPVEVENPSYTGPVTAQRPARISGVPVVMARAPVAIPRPAPRTPVVSASRAQDAPAAVQLSPEEQQTAARRVADISFYNVIRGTEQLQKRLERGEITRKEYEREKCRLIIYS